MEKVSPICFVDKGQNVVEAQGLENTNLRAYITTREFGNMRFPDLGLNLCDRLSRFRDLTGCENKIISPYSQLTRKIFPFFGERRAENYCPNFCRSKAVEKFDGAIIGANGDFQAYALANADCPIGFIFGGSRTGNQPKAVCMHLALECIREGILKEAIKLAKRGMEKISGFFYGFGIGAPEYLFSLNHPHYEKQNKELYRWLEHIGVKREIENRTFSIDLFEICEKILGSYKFTGEIIREKSILCTASAKTSDGRHLFYSNRRDRGKPEQNFRNMVVVCPRKTS